MRFMKIVSVAAGVVIVALTGWLLVGSKPRMVGNVSKDKTNPKQQSSSQVIKGEIHSTAKQLQNKGRSPVTRPRADWMRGLSAADRRMATDVQEALDAEDFERVRDAAVRAFRSVNAEVRLHAIEALEWFDEKALPELTPLMGDRDEDVANAAMFAWDHGLSGIDNAQLRMEIASLALQTITGKDALAMIGSKFAGAALEWIDSVNDEQKSAERRVAVVQKLVDILEADQSNVRLDAAKEVYEEITGHAWAGIVEAEKYLANPDEYEPPEDADGKQE